MGPQGLAGVGLCVMFMPNWSDSQPSLFSIGYNMNNDLEQKSNKFIIVFIVALTVISLIVLFIRWQKSRELCSQQCSHKTGYEDCYQECLANEPNSNDNDYDRYNDF